MSNQFWSSPNMEPKRSFRFVLYIGGFPHWVVKTSGRPSFKIASTAHSYLNHKFKFPGSITWEDIKVTLVEAIDSNSISEMKKVLKDSGYAWMDPRHNIGPNDLNTISKKRAVAALAAAGGKKGTTLVQIDSEGNTIDEWTLWNCWISSFTPSELSYESEELTSTELTLTFDYAKVETPQDNK
jgi:hypothetical protein